MSSIKEYLIVIGVILSIIFLGLMAMFHYNYFTAFYWDCRSIGYMDTQEKAENIMSKYQVTGMTATSKANKDTTVTFVNEKGEMFCQLDILDGKVVNTNFFTVSL